MSRRFAVVYEAGADFRTATELADRVVVEAVDWLNDEDDLLYQREWISSTQSGKRLAWTKMPSLAGELGIKAHGHFDGDPGLPDAAAARRAIRFLLETYDNLDVIVLIRDQDDQRQRREGLDQARNEARDHHRIVIVVGFAIVERECWVLTGFDPQNKDQSSKLEDERSRLGFDPRLRNHDLTACKDDAAKLSPKRVLRVLSSDDRDRERHCWKSTALSLLQERGEENGLTAFLDEVRTHLAPLIGHVSNS